jgi:hypothetical protein
MLLLLLLQFLCTRLRIIFFLKLRLHFLYERISLLLVVTKVQCWPSLTNVQELSMVACICWEFVRYVSAPQRKKPLLQIDSSHDSMFSYEMEHLWSPALCAQLWLWFTSTGQFWRQEELDKSMSSDESLSSLFFSQFRLQSLGLEHGHLCQRKGSWQE